MTHDEQYYLERESALIQAREFAMQGADTEYVRSYMFDAGIAYARQHSDPHMGVSDTWTPTAQSINALPEPIRQYIHDLETRADPSGDIQTIASLREQLDGLQVLAQEHSRPRIPRELWERMVVRTERPLNGAGAWGMMEILDEYRELLRELLEHVQPEDQ